MKTMLKGPLRRNKGGMLAAVSKDVDDELG
jgi:hypothetical protein